MAEKENKTMNELRAYYWYRDLYLCLGRLYSREDLEDYAASTGLELKITEKAVGDK